MVNKLILIIVFILSVSYLSADYIPGLSNVTVSGIDEALNYDWTGDHVFEGNADFTTVTIGGGATVAKILTGTASINFTAKTSSCEDSTGVTVTGATDGAYCQVGVPAALWGTGDTYSCYVSSAGTAKIRHCNAGVGADPGGATTVTVLVTQ